MNNIIAQESKGLREYGEALCREAESKLAVRSTSASAPRVDNRPVSHTSHPERPWRLGGAAALGIGAITVLADNSVWGYLLGAAGIASICISYAKQKSNQPQTENTQNDAAKTSGLDMADQILNISNMIENKWKDRVETAKVTVQHVIMESSANDSVKQSLKDETFVTERINLNVSPYIDKLNGLMDTDACGRIVKDFLSYLKTTVMNVVDKQTGIYNSIAEKL